MTENNNNHGSRNLALELVRATEAAAIAAGPWVGAGDKNAADGAAVDAMRYRLSSVSFNGTVVIGEGEKTRPPCCLTVKSLVTAPAPTSTLR